MPIPKPNQSEGAPVKFVVNGDAPKKLNNQKKLHKEKSVTEIKKLMAGNK